ncbi:MAG: class I SAM-dependent methyltransferase [Kiritimatiellaeota bacterium]|nr:class I SAM-dependent methyltransferase [Kiritimatiellota bacterium]
MTEMLPCDICGGLDACSVLQKDGGTYVRCAGCGFVYAWPRPDSVEDVNEEYFAQTLEEYVRASFSKKRQRRYRRALRRFAAFRGSGRLLEVGCNVGGFLKAARDLGWDPVGVEPVAPCARYGRQEFGLEIIPATLDRAELEAEIFDFAYSNAVFEHLPSPCSVMAEIARVLKPGGVVYTKTVNFDSYTREQLGATWKLLAPSGHLCLFNAETLSAVCRKAGLEVFRVESNGVRVRKGPFESLRKGAYSTLSRFTLRGDRIIVWARKPDRFPATHALCGGRERCRETPAGTKRGTKPIVSRTRRISTVISRDDRRQRMGDRPPLRTEKCRA